VHEKGKERRSQSVTASKEGELKRGLSPLLWKNLPLPLDKGKGIKGIGF